MYKLGKKPARKGAIKFELENYEMIPLPAPPEKYGHHDLISTWNMYANDKYGDCVWAGAGHETLLWNKEVNKDVTFTDDNILESYSAVTGFNPSDPDSDGGTDMEEAAKYRRQVGLLDSDGVRHQVGAYLAISPGDVDKLKQAVYLFSAVGIGIMFPDTAMKQFDEGKPWKVVRGAHVDGGHYVPVVGYDEQYFYVVTWGKIQPVSYAFIRRYMDEGVVYLSPEFLNTTGRSLEGFDLDTLTKNLNSL